jgi:Uncharacterized conserved protein
MSDNQPRIVLAPCPKGYTRDLDKTMSPAQTIARVRERLNTSRLDILSQTRRVDVGRLGIPVFLSVCGADARRIMPTRKQMGKGSSAEQAEASALMELMERFAFFSFWDDRPHMVSATWSEAEARFGNDLLPLEAMLRSVDDSLSPQQARRVLNLTPWQFYPATCLADGRTVWLPLDWFKLLGEFNGTSAGNSAEESLLQGLSELVERHATEKLTVKMIGITDWNGDGQDEWIVSCFVEPKRGGRTRIYYLLVPPPLNDKEKLKGTVAAIYECFGLACNLYVRDSKVIERDAADPLVPPTVVQDVVPGLQPVTTPPSKNTSKSDGLEERNL